MWYFLLFSLALVLAMAPFWLGLLPPLNARCVIRVSKGRCRVQGAALPQRVVTAAEEVLRTAGVAKGFIAITANTRVKFSCHIPKTIHQRLRNVVLNP